MDGKTAGYPAVRPDTWQAALDPRCRRYVVTGYKKVQGWLIRLAALQIARLGQIQLALGVAGAACEIGVHHGRTLILLHLLTRPGEATVAIDLYELLHAENGRARKAQLLRNVRSHGGEVDRIRVVSEDSVKLTPQRILELCAGRPRLFSIDGGRTAEITCHDLALAHATVCDGGVVMVHDYFQEGWPEVSEGVCRFMGRQPVAIGARRFTRVREEDLVAADCNRVKPGLAQVFAVLVRRSIMFGEPVLVLMPLTLKRQVARTRVWQAVRDWPVGRMLRNIGNSVR